jgi:hypothetical protein
MYQFPSIEVSLLTLCRLRLNLHKRRLRVLGVASVAAAVVDECRWAVVTPGTSLEINTAISLRLTIRRILLLRMTSVVSGTRTQPDNQAKRCPSRQLQCSHRAAIVVGRWDLVVHCLDLAKILERLQEQERPLNRRKRKTPPMQIHLGKQHRNSGNM